MTEAEIRKWLGVTGDPRPLRQEILDGMAECETPLPGDDTSQVNTFRAFLRCAGSPSDRVFTDA